MVRKKLTNFYEGVQTKSREHIYQRPYILPILGLLIGLAIVFGVVLTRHGQSLKVSDYHVVYVFDRGQRQIINTKAKTVGELVNKLPLQLSRQDVVEPAIDTPIPEDNYRINIYRARPVTVVDHGQRKVTLTAQRSARVIAEAANLKVYPEDEATFGEGNIAANTIGEEVVINRAVPVVLSLYDEKLDVKTRAKTVAGLLAEKGVKIDKGDTVKPKSSTPIKPGLEVSVIHNGTKTLTRKETIPMPIKYVADSSLSFGAEVVRQKGSPGRQAITYRIVTKKGKVISRKVIQKVIIEEPVPQVVARGAVVDVAGNKKAIMKAAGVRGSDYGYVNFVISRESNWNPAARNAAGCLGLGQACPGSKLTNACSLSDPVCQLRFFSGYAGGRYGGWGGAYDFWLSHGYW